MSASEVPAAAGRMSEQDRRPLEAGAASIRVRINPPQWTWHPITIKCILFSALLVCVAAPATAQEQPTVIFPARTFYDRGNIVHIEGTLSEEGIGIGYPNNHTVLTCYEERHECSAVQIDSKDYPSSCHFDRYV
jgi:hypothetical protein